VRSFASAAIVVDGAWAPWSIRQYRIHQHLHLNPNPFVIRIFMTA